MLTRSVKALFAAMALGLVSAAMIASPPAARAYDAYPCGAQWYNARFDLDVQYCPDWSPTGTIPVYDDNVNPTRVVGTMPAGHNWYVCDTTGYYFQLRSGSNIYSNIYWAYTVANNGQRGWVNETYFKGGGDFESDGGLVSC
jgi:hypothetical protein